jgi:uncharacterized protein YdhG (YjbR/CyaY superfamily)
MDKTKIDYATIDDYIAACPKNVQPILKKLRATIKAAAPKAEEKISYRMPAFFQNGVLVYFAAFKNHIGFFPTASGIQSFKKEISSYKNSKGTVQFPLDQPLPFNLIRKIVKFKISENSKKADEKQQNERGQKNDLL